ncbi:MAG TPA: 4Fe-4S dicluster domain-containing protein [Kofleriaceae bacterium]|nr:4Fe-4S dicluster domain-containing protein [Kofleriaceae bacterium]
MTRTVGFLTDATLCIGCKACEVACKQWNDLPSDGFRLSGLSYDNTVALGATTWRHVTFAEQAHDEGVAWKMISDVCKHCEHAGCLDACPTGAIIRTEHGSVFVQPDICNGCGYCVPACPFGVVAKDEHDGRAAKCTLCYDRLQGGLEPACAKACPTDSIQFGPVDELRGRAAARVNTVAGTRVYDPPGVGGIHALFVLADEPEVYNLPPAPVVPTRGVGRSWLAAAAGALGLVVLAAITSRR